MGAKQTPYDKYPDGCWCCGGTKYPRCTRNRWAIEEGLEDWESYWDWRSYSDGCYCSGGMDPDDLCYVCTHPDRGGRSYKIPDHDNPVQKYKSPAKKAGGCQHIWNEREKWMPQRRYYGQQDFETMELTRLWICVECREEKVLGPVTVRPKKMTGRWRYSRSITREMTKQEREKYNSVTYLKSISNWWDRQYKFKKDSYAPYGYHEDGSPVYRDEFKQAPKKRLTRKREE